MKKRKERDENENDPKKKEDYVHATEGLRENSYFYCNRNEKILDLMEKLDDKNIIYIRSPTGTGKSSLIHLIQLSKEYKEKYEIFDFYNMIKPQDSLVQFKEKTGYSDFLDALEKYEGEKHILYIIDDAQNVFTVKDSKEISIIDSIKPMHNRLNNLDKEKRKVHVLILATHGEKTLGKISSQITLPYEQILGIEYLLFSKNEYDLAMKNLITRNGPDLTDLPISFFKFTNGHPGLLSQTVYQITLYFSQEKKNWANFDKKELTNYCLSNDFFGKIIDYKIFHDIMNDNKDMEFNANRKEAIQAIERLINSPTQKLELNSQNHLISVSKETSNFLRKIGICKFEAGTEKQITWAYGSVRFFYMRIMAPIGKSMKNYDDIDVFTNDFLRLLPYDRLKDRLDPELYGRKLAINHPKEIFYQNMFFMIALQLLGKSVFPEIGKKMNICDNFASGSKTCGIKEIIELKKGEIFSFLFDQKESGDTNVAVTSKDLLNLVKKGDKIFVEDGPTFSVTKVNDSSVDTIIKKEGHLKENDELSISKKAGYIDFYVNSTHQYGFEFLLDGSSMEGHYNRFCLNGDYSFLKLKNFQLINFTTKKPQDETLEKYKGMTFVYFHDDFKKATINYFRREEVDMNLLSNNSITEKRGITKIGESNFICDKNTYFNLRNGSYDEEFTINLQKNQSTIKILTLLLFDRDMKRIATKKINDVPILLETFKERVKELFKENLKSKEFIINYDNEEIENDNDLFNIPENSPIDIILK